MIACSQWEKRAEELMQRRKVRLQEASERQETPRKRSARATIETTYPTAVGATYVCAAEGGQIRTTAEER